MSILYTLLALIVAFAAYVRLAPSQAARFHVENDFQVDTTLPGGVQVVLQGAAQQIAALDAIISATPRTKRLAGGIAEGRVTYVTRSRGFGFPDYTTVDVAGDELKIYARLRFGRSDLGVNGKRVKGWIKALGAM